MKHKYSRADISQINESAQKVMAEQYAQSPKGKAEAKAKELAAVIKYRRELDVKIAQAKKELAELEASEQSTKTMIRHKPGKRTRIVRVCCSYEWHYFVHNPFKGMQEVSFTEYTLFKSKGARVYKRQIIL